MRLSQEPVLFTYGAYPVPKRAPLLEDFNVNLLSMVQGGIVNHLVTTYIPPKYFIPEKQASPLPSPFKLEHIALITCMWMCGLFISLLAFIAELLNKMKCVTELSNVPNTPS